MSATHHSATAAEEPGGSTRAIKAKLFRALGHPIRVRVIELLRARPEMSVRDLQTALQIELGAASQHLAAMRRQRLLTTRRQGTSVLYKVRDPRTFQMFEVARQILTSQHRRTQTLLAGLNAAQQPASERSRRESR